MSKTITFDEINRIAADHARREATRNAPAAVARRAVFTLSSLLSELPPADRAAIIGLVAVELELHAAVMPATNGAAS